MSESKLDRISKQIIEELADNARISNRELAEKVFLSPSACLKRTKKLEEQGYIRHYTLDLNLQRLCASVMAMARVTLADNQGLKSSIAFEKEIARIPQAVEVFRTTGESDYLVHLICKDIEQLEQIRQELLSRGCGVARLQTDIITATPKPFKAYPLNELDW